jgi:hypothetical protein
LEVRCTSKNLTICSVGDRSLAFVVHCIRTDNDITQDEVARTMHASALPGTHQVAGFHASNSASLPAKDDESVRLPGHHIKSWVSKAGNGHLAHRYLPRERWIISLHCLPRIFL